MAQLDLLTMAAKSHNKAQKSLQSSDNSPEWPGQQENMNPDGVFKSLNESLRKEKKWMGN